MLEVTAFRVEERKLRGARIESSIHLGSPSDVISTLLGNMRLADRIGEEGNSREQLDILIHILRDSSLLEMGVTLLKRARHLLDQIDSLTPLASRERRGELDLLKTRLAQLRIQLRPGETYGVSELERLEKQLEQLAELIHHPPPSIQSTPARRELREEIKISSGRETTTAAIPPQMERDESLTSRAIEPSTGEADRSGGSEELAKAVEKLSVRVRNAQEKGRSSVEAHDLPLEQVRAYQIIRGREEAPGIRLDLSTGKLILAGGPNHEEGKNGEGDSAPKGVNLRVKED